MRVNGRLALITGASSGIGAATARALAASGAHVILVARDKAALDDVAARISGRGGRASVFRSDLSDAAEVERVTRAIGEEVGQPEILVNNAGAGRWLFVEETPPAEAVQMMAVPYLAAFAVTRAYLPAMLRRDSGHIVNLTSPAAYLPWPGATAYAAARWAMRGFTEALRADLCGTGIGVTLMVPGLVRSPYFAHNPGAQERIPRIARLYPTLTPEQVAAATVRAIERNSREVVLPRSLGLTMLAHRVLPGPIQELVTRTGWHRRRADRL